MGLGRAEVKAILQRHDLSPSRALGQNFLTEPNVAMKIVRLGSVKKSDNVLEIGPGIGSLSVDLAAAANSVVAIELDRYVIPALLEVLQNRGVTNVEIICEDAMKVDFEDVLGKWPIWKLVANLPYNISTPLVLSLLESQPKIAEMVIMVQREVGERMCAKPGNSLYSQVALKLNYFASAKIVSSVSRDVFIPRPNVESVLVHVIRRPDREIDLDPSTYELVFSLSRLAFANRRQMLRRTLASVVSSEDFDRAAVDSTRRPETIQLAEWKALANSVLRRAN